MEHTLLQYLPDPNTVKGGITEVVEIVQREAPLVVEELIRWHIFYNLAGFIAAILIFILALWGLKYGWKMSQRDKFVDGFKFFCGITLPLMFMLTGFVWVWFTLGWAKPWLAPRLFLLEYLSDLLHLQ